MSFTGPPPRDLAPPTPSADNPVFRRHSRRRSSQIIVPPIQPAGLRLRRSSGDSNESDAASINSSNRNSMSTANNTLSPPGTASSDGSLDIASDLGADDSAMDRRMVSSASFLIVAQFFAKVLTFGLNQVLLRFVDPAVFGANAQLVLLMSTCLYFAREAVRLATQRITLVGKKLDGYRFEGGTVVGTRSGTAQQVVNFGFVPVAVGVPLTLLGSALYWAWTAQKVSEQAFLGDISGTLPSPGTQREYALSALMIFSCATILELLSEPFFVLIQLHLDYKTRASFESMAVTAQCVLTFIFVFGARTTYPGSGVVAFALGQLVYSSVLCGLYVVYGIRLNRNNRDVSLVWPQPVWTRPEGGESVYFDAETKALTVSIWLQSFFKHCLGEGDRFLVSALLSVADQGVYALVVNYGSLAARLVFAPVEETLRSFLSKLNSAKRANHIDQSANVLATILRVYVYMSLYALIFGPLVTPFALSHLVSPVWMATGAPDVLALYTCYIPFLAVNGVLEAYVQAVASAQDIKRQGSVMLALSVSLAFASYILMSAHALDLGAQGLVYASMTNMALRIIWASSYIEAYFKSHRPKAVVDSTKSFSWLRPAVPAVSVLLTALGVGVTARYYVGLVHSPNGLMRHVALAIILGTSILWSERSTLQYLLK